MNTILPILQAAPSLQGRASRKIRRRKSQPVSAIPAFQTLFSAPTKASADSIRVNCWANIPGASVGDEFDS